MKSKRFVILVSIIFFVSMIIGIYLYRNLNKNSKIGYEYTEKVFDERTNVNNNIENEVINANSIEEKVTPNTKLILRTYYEECGHSINEYVELPSELINMTKEELKNKYKNWQIISFSEKEIIMQKSINSFCDEHYILKDIEGYVQIFKKSESGDEKLIQKTSISTKYLTENDRSHLNIGIKVYGKENLNKVLEDFE